MELTKEQLKFTSEIYNKAAGVQSKLYINQNKDVKVKIYQDNDITFDFKTDVEGKYISVNLDISFISSTTVEVLMYYILYKYELIKSLK